MDGSKLKLPRPLIKVGYRLPSDNAHYPQGLLSCLYRLRSRVPVDFDLVTHGNERKAAGSHLHALSENDVVVYDRGYFSQALLREHLARGLHPVFRLRVNANGTVAAFANSTETDTVVEIAARPGREEPLVRPLVKYAVSGSAYLSWEPLLDRDQYRIAELPTSTSVGALRNHIETDSALKTSTLQELFAHFVLITLTRLFSNQRLRSGATGGVAIRRR